MLHDDLHKDMDPDYRSQIFYTRKKMLSDVGSHTILPENGLNARSMLNEWQLNKVLEIRDRKLSAVMDRFARD